MNRLEGWKSIAVCVAVAAMVLSCAAGRSGATRAETAEMRRAALASLAQGDPMQDYPQPLATYTTVKAGDPTRLARLLPTTPPQIPHNIEGLLPIDLEENACLACHLPDNAGAQDIPIPASHFLRPKVEVVLMRADPPPGVGPMLSYVAGYSKEEELLGMRYNCVQCHTPRAENPPFSPPRVSSR